MPPAGSLSLKYIAILAGAGDVGPKKNPLHRAMPTISSRLLGVPLSPVSFSHNEKQVSSVLSVVHCCDGSFCLRVIKNEAVQLSLPLRVYFHSLGAV